MVGVRYRQKLHSTREASNGGRVRLCIIHGLNISHKELTYFVREADSTNTYGDRAPFGSAGGGGRTKSGSRRYTRAVFYPASGRTDA